MAKGDYQGRGTTIIVGRMGKFAHITFYFNKWLRTPICLKKKNLLFFLITNFNKVEGYNDYSLKIFFDEYLVWKSDSDKNDIYFYI